MAKKNISRLWLWLITGFMLVGGCSGLGKPGERINYYVLEYPSPAITGLEPIPAVVRLERFSVAPQYDTERIVYREKDFVLETYNYHRWRANPGDLVTYFLERDFRESGLFRGVLPRDSRLSPDRVLEGSVEEILEWDGPDQWEAVLAVSIALIARDEPDVSRSVLYQATYREREPCARNHPKALSEAMSRAMARISRRIIIDVHGVMKQEG
jgi:ABC-type uncharacterized transport system auxiliary subunit